MKKKDNKNKFSGGSLRNALLLVIVAAVGLGFLNQLMYSLRGQVHYSQFLKRVTQGDVKKVVISGQNVEGLFRDDTVFKTVIPAVIKDWELLQQHDVDIEIKPVTQTGFWLFLLLLALISAWMAWYYFMRQSKGQGGGGYGSNIFSMGKSRAKMFMPSTIKEKFSSVAGAQEAKEELEDVVDFLKNPKKYQRLGAHMTRGVLLVGDPGNGKTLLAKAVAGEANCPFFSISGSDFIEVFVGVGASRVRDLFDRARKHSPSIVFIDEIDAVGRHRGSGLGGGNDEREQTLNQLLTEMDGFQTSDTSVMVLAATNRPDVLDKALLRPGRFDRRVHVPFPDLTSREAILKLHAKKVKLDKEVDLAKIARGTSGFSGADLANIINEAAIIASKTDQNTIKIHDFEEARDKIILGKESKSMIQTKDELKVTAFHEAGHALIRLLLPEISDPLYKITIVPRGGALGVTHSIPERDKYSTNKQEYEAFILSACGGRAAEEIVFSTATSGAYSDFQKATEIVRNMVCRFGMSEKIGPVIYEQGHGKFQYSENTAQEIDKEVQSMMKQYYEKAFTMIKNNRDKLDVLAEALLEKETLYASEVYELLGIESREDHKFS